jgi:hypothetical protein
MKMMAAILGRRMGMGINECIWLMPVYFCPQKKNTSFFCQALQPHRHIGFLDPSLESFDMDLHREEVRTHLDLKHRK